jgi:CoA:oxalate CoA-transferase
VPSESAQLLNGIIVLDFTRMLAGPYCTALLSDLGATIIKVEPPHGDDQRHIGALEGDYSFSFEVLNRNKRSITINLKNPEGVKLAQTLAAHADVVVENYRPGVSNRLGIGYETLRRLNPRIVVASISGFGQDGPMAQAPSYDVIAQALSGLMSITGTPEGEPSLVGESIADVAAGIFAAFAIGMALYSREKTGYGQHIDVALFDSLFSMLPTALAQWQLTGKAPERIGNSHAFSAPFGAFRARDGLFTIAVANNKLFAALAQALGMPELPEMPEFANDALRHQHQAKLTQIVENWAATRSAAEVAQELSTAGVPASTVWNVDQAARSSQVRARELLARVPHPGLGSVFLPQQPVHFSDAPRHVARPAPELGSDTEAVLAGMLHLSPDEITRLFEEGAIIAKENT